MRKWVYICSPYRPVGDTEEKRTESLKGNILLAKKACVMAVEMGFMPIAPHLYLTQFLDDLDERQRRLGLELGLEILETCDELWIIGERVSDGMAGEICYAAEHDIPVKAVKDPKIPSEQIRKAISEAMMQH